MKGLVTVLLVVQLLGLLTGVTLGLLPVEEVEALSLEKLVDFGTCDTGEHLLGEFVLGSFTVAFLTLLVFSHGEEGGTESNGFVRELALVLLRVLVVCLGGREGC